MIEILVGAVVLFSVICLLGTLISFFDEFFDFGYVDIPITIEIIGSIEWAIIIMLSLGWLCYSIGSVILGG